MKSNRIKAFGSILYTYQTTVLVHVHEHAIKGVIKLENHYIPIQICRESLSNLKPIITQDFEADVYSDPPIILPVLTKWKL